MSERRAYQGRRRLESVRIADCGDADVIYYDAERNVEIIEAAVRSILDRGALPVVIGGDPFPEGQDGRARSGGGEHLPRPR